MKDEGSILMMTKAWLAALAVAALPLHAGALTINCGDTIGPEAGSVVVDNGVACSTGGTPAITIVGPGTKVDFNNHEVDCNSGTTEEGIVIDGKGAKVENAIVVGCQDIGVVVAGDGGHKLTNVHARSSDNFGIWVISDKNKLDSCSALSNSTLGFQISGAGNKISSSTALANGSDGFYLEGESNKVSKSLAAENLGSGFVSVGEGHSFSQCQAASNAESGFVVFFEGKLIKNEAGGNLETGITAQFGSGFIIKKNRAIGNGSQGILLTSAVSDSKIGGNRALGNSIDLSDESCSSNTWSKSSFGTSNGACVE